jgi:hypothetical protein
MSETGMLKMLLEMDASIEPNPIEEPEYHEMVKQARQELDALLAENEQQKVEIDHYDKVCTEVRNVLTVCDIPELTGDRLTVLPLATRVYLLGTIGAKEMERNALLRKQLDEARKALDELQQAEAKYRDMHDVIGDGTITAGRAWDEMRHSGDCARLWLASHPKDGEE